MVLFRTSLSGNQLKGRWKNPFIWNLHHFMSGVQNPSLLTLMQFRYGMMAYPVTLQLSQFYILNWYPL